MSLPEQYKKDVNEILETISTSVSKKVSDDVKHKVDEIIRNNNSEKHKCESSINNIEKKIRSNQEDLSKKLKEHTDRTNNIINEFKRSTDSNLSEILQVLNTDIKNKFDESFKQIEKRQERLLKLNRLTFVILSIVILIELFNLFKSLYF